MGKGGYWGKQSFITPFPYLVETPQTVFAAMSSEDFKEHISLWKHKIWRHLENGAKVVALFEAEG